MSEVIHHAAVEAVEARPERWECENILVTRTAPGNFNIDDDGDANIHLTIDDLRYLHAILSEILSPSVPPSPTVTPSDAPKFKVGDRVRVVRNTYSPVAEVLDVTHGGKWFTVQHDGNMASDSYRPDELELVVPAPSVPPSPSARYGPKFKVGDMVRRRDRRENQMAKTVEAVRDGAILIEGGWVSDALYDFAPLPAPVAAPTPAKCVRCETPLANQRCQNRECDFYCANPATTSEARPSKCPTCQSDTRADRLMTGNINDRYVCFSKWHEDDPAPSATPTPPAANFDEAKERDAFLAWAVKYGCPFEENSVVGSFARAAWLSRARSGAGR